MTGAVNSLLLLLKIYMDQIPGDSKNKVLVIITVIETSILPAIRNHNNDLGDIEALIADVKEKCQRQPQHTAEKKTRQKKRQAKTREDKTRKDERR